MKADLTICSPVIGVSNNIEFGFHVKLRIKNWISVLASLC